MKLFLLTAGYGYYPMAGTRDWIDTFETEEAAQEAVEELDSDDTDGKYKIDDCSYDWYYIINLNDWINR